MAALRNLTYGVDVCLLELSVAPLASAKHFSCELGLEFCAHWLVVCTFSDLVRFLRGDSKKFTLLKLIDHFLVMSFDGGACNKDLELCLIFVLQFFRNTNDLLFLITSNLNPLVFHGLGKANLSDLGTDDTFNICLERLLVELKSRAVLEFGCADALILLTFLCQLYLSLLNHLKHDIVIDEQGFKSCIDLQWGQIERVAQLHGVGDLLIFVQLRQHMLLELIIGHSV